MKNNISTYIVYGLIGLAFIGLIGAISTDAIGLVRGLLFAVITGFVIFGIFYFFFVKKRTTDELKKYRKAVKQSKQKYPTSYQTSKASLKQTKQSHSLNKINHSKERRDASHLRVIDGNKKRKNRATL
jgi:type III secretory pathway component EscU